MLDEAPQALSQADPARTLVWTLTDGIAYFRGAAAPALARLAGIATIGSDNSLFALCQDKFRSGAVLAALGLPAPAAGLARNGEWLVRPPPSESGYFVKPNRLGAKIGIWPESRCRELGSALELSRRVFSAYRDDVVVQPYVAGRNVRASFLAVDPGAGVKSLGIFFVESDGDFQTMADSMALYGDTGMARQSGWCLPRARPRAGRGDPAGGRPPHPRHCPHADGDARLKDVFTMDLRVETDDTVHLIEFEVCPGLPCFDFRAYCATQWQLTLPDAIAETAARRFFNR